MRYRPAVALIALAATSVLSSCSGGSGTGSNREISAAIESAWNGARAAPNEVLETDRRTSARVRPRGET